MVHAVFHHKPDSPYDDRPDRYYHFPKIYLDRVRSTVGDRIIYYGPVGKKAGFYTGSARVAGIRADGNRPNHFYADMVDYIDFDRPVHYRTNGGYERRLVTADGGINGGHAINAVRIIDESEYAAILAAGLSEREPWPDRNDFTPEYDVDGLSESESIFEFRPVSLQITNRLFRERKFKHHVRDAYDRTCAFTGLRLLNGQGRPEVEAAHIVPVSHGGTDSVRNGIALSGTVHWMFDRGLLSLANNYKILLSRKLNHDVSNLLVPSRTAIIPDDVRFRPHPECLRWHRQKWDFEETLPIP